MINILMFCFVLVGFFTAALAASSRYARDEFMSVAEAEKKWGKATFDVEKFK